MSSITFSLKSSSSRSLVSVASKSSCSRFRESKLSATYSAFPRMFRSTSESFPFKMTVTVSSGGHANCGHFDSSDALNDSSALGGSGNCSRSSFSIALVALYFFRKSDILDT